MLLKSSMKSEYQWDGYLDSITFEQHCVTRNKSQCCTIMWSRHNRSSFNMNLHDVQIMSQQKIGPMRIKIWSHVSVIQPPKSILKLFCKPTQRTSPVLCAYCVTRISGIIRGVRAVFGVKKHWICFTQVYTSEQALDILQSNGFPDHHWDARVSPRKL